VSDSTAVPSLLDLLPALCRDLRWAIFPHYPAILHTLMEIIDETDADLMERVFHAIGYVFKYLQKELVKDMDTLLRHYLPLLTHKREFVRSFAAESYSYLLRRLEREDLAKSLKSLMRSSSLLPLIATSSLSHTVADTHHSGEGYLLDGISRLLFSVMRGVKGAFHSKMQFVFQTILQIFSETPRNYDSESFDFSLHIVSKVLKDVMDYGSDLSLANVWDMIFLEWKKYLTLCQTHKEDDLEECTFFQRFSLFLQIVHNLLLSNKKTTKRAYSSEVWAIVRDTWATVDWRVLLTRRDAVTNCVSHEFVVSCLDVTSALIMNVTKEKETAKGKIQEIFHLIFSIGPLLHSDVHFRSLSRFVICASAVEVLCGVFIDSFLPFLQSFPLESERYLLF